MTKQILGIFQQLYYLPIYIICVSYFFPNLFLRYQKKKFGSQNKLKYNLKSNITVLFNSLSLYIYIYKSFPFLKRIFFISIYLLLSILGYDMWTTKVAHELLWGHQVIKDIMDQLQKIVFHCETN